MNNGDKNKEKFHTGNVLFLSAIHLIHDVFSAFLAPLLPLLINKHGITFSAAGFLTVMQRIPSLMNPVLGILADKVSLRYFVIIAPAITSVTMSLIGVAPTYTVLMILCFVMGLSSAMFHVPSPVMIKSVSGTRIGKGMSFYMLGGELARSIGPLVIMAAVGVWGLEGTYKLMAFGITASFIMFLKFRKVNFVHTHIKTKKESIKGTVKSVLPFFSKIGGVIFFRLLVKGALTTFLPVYLTVKGESVWFAGIALSVLQISGAAGTFLSGSFSDYFGRKKTLLYVGVLVPVLMYLFIISEGVFVFLFLILLGFIMFASEPVLLAYVNERKTERPAFINGLYMGMNFGISALSILIVGFAGDHIGLETTYNLTVFSGILSIPFILALPEK